MEATKAPVQARLKPVQQPFIKKNVKDGIMKNIMEISSDNSRTHVVVFETQAESFPQSVVGSGEGGEGGINGKNKIEEKILKGNNLNIPLKFNLNSKIVKFGKLRDSRKARWLGRGLIVNVNEFGKRRVSWDGVNGGKQAGKWVASNNAHNTIVGLDPPKQKTQALLGSKKPILGLGLSSPLNFKASESSFNGPNALEPNY